MGKTSNKQEFTSPQLQVPCKTGAIKINSKEFVFRNSLTGLNSRLKLELFDKDPTQADVKNVALSVLDLDDLFTGDANSRDGWFVVYNSVTRQKVGQVQCTIRCVPEAFFPGCFAGDNPVIHAARHGQTECLRMLLSAGMSDYLSLSNREGNTSLIVAAKDGHRSCVELLLRRGADINIKNKGGLTAMDMAEKFEQNIITSILKGLIQKRENVAFNLNLWPGEEGEVDPIAFLNNRFRGEYCDSRLELEMVGAKHLPKADIMGLSDPYIEMNLNGVKHTSRVVFRSLQPIWNEKYTFDDQSLGVWEGQTIKFDVYDWDRLGAELLGSFKVDISTIVKLQSETANESEMTEAWFPLVDKDGNTVRGNHDDKERAEGILEDSQVCLRFRFTPAKGRFLAIGIMEARNIPALPAFLAKTNALPSAFATVSLGSNMYRTDPIKNDKNPRWEMAYRFSAKYMDSVICVEIHELKAAKKNSKGLKKTLEPCEASMIGRIKVPVQTFFSLNNANFKDIWVELEDCNGVKLLDNSGNLSALRLSFEFVVIGELPDSESDSSVPLQLTRSTKLTYDVVCALNQDDDSNSARGIAMAEFDRLKTLFKNEITAEGMFEAAQVLSVEMSIDVIIVRLLTNTKNGQCVRDFHEFCKVLGLRELINVQQKIVGKDELAVVGMRVVLCEDTITSSPQLVEDSGGGPVSHFF